jgi:hypothetical protein
MLFLLFGRSFLPCLAQNHPGTPSPPLDVLSAEAGQFNLLSDFGHPTSSLSALARNYDDVLGRASGGGSEPFVFDLRQESCQVFASEGPLEGRSGFLVSPPEG